MRGKSDISQWTFALMVGGTAVLACLVIAGMVMPAFVPAGRTEAVAAVMTDVGSVLFGALAAGVLLSVAFRFQRSNPLRQIWLLMGIGLALRTVGDIVWTVLDVGSRYSQIPYPSAADIFYVATYLFMGLGLLRAVKAFRRVTYAEAALKWQVVLMFLVAVGIYVFVAAPIIVDHGAGLMEKVFGVFYPMADVVVLIGPALFIAFVAGAIGKTQCVRHWWLLAAGLAVWSIADLAFTWLDWRGLYYSGSPVDYVWMLSLLMVAIAASLAADVSIRPAAAPPAVRSAD